MIPLFLRSDKVKVMIPPNPILIVHCILLHIYPSVSYRYIVRGGEYKARYFNDYRSRHI